MSVMPDLTGSVVVVGGCLAVSILVPDGVPHTLSPIVLIAIFVTFGIFVWHLAPARTQPRDWILLSLGVLAIGFARVVVARFFPPTPDYASGRLALGLALATVCFAGGVRGYIQRRLTQ